MPSKPRASKRTCPACDKPVTDDDRFCRACGAKVEPKPSKAKAPATGASGAFGSSLSSFKNRLHEHPAIAGIAALVIVAMVVGLALVALGGGDGKKKPTAAEIAQRRLEADRKAFGEPFKALMQERDAFFAQERTFVSTIKAAQQKAFAYFLANEKYNTDIERISAEASAAQNICDTFGSFCPTPTFPDPPRVPDLNSEIQSLRQVAQRLQELAAALDSTPEPDELGVFATQFRSAVDVLIAQSNQDADVLTEAITPPENCDECTGFVDNNKLKEMHTDDALPSIGHMNAAALEIIDRLKLLISSFDVSGGKDIDPTDHSTLLPDSSGTPPAT